MRYLMTHSLLSAWRYALEGESMEDFLKTLHREPTETSAAMKRGVEFEELVTAIVNGTGDQKHKWFTAAEKIAGSVLGGQLQHVGEKEVTINGMDLLLYGRLDALKAGTIYDIKYSSKYQVGKFYESTQHPMYLELVPEAKRFTYLVSDGKDVWTETYLREETRSIYTDIQFFLSWMEACGYLGKYKDKWKAKNS